jgi:hypothetical protein
MFSMDLFFKSAAAGMKIVQIGMENMFKMMELFAGLACQKEKPAKTEVPGRKKTTDTVHPPPVEKVQAPVKVSPKTVTSPYDKKEMSSKGTSPSASETAPEPASRQKTIPLKSDIKTEKKAVSPKKGSPSKKKPSTAIDQVRAFMALQKQGVSAEDIMTATGFNKKKVQDILYKLKKRGILKSDKGIYSHV